MTNNPSFAKHTLAALKYTARIRAHKDNELPLVDEIKRIKQEIKDYISNRQEPSFDWIKDKEIIINQIQQQLTSGARDLAIPYLGECETIKNDLFLLKSKQTDPSHQFPSLSRIQTSESSRRENTSPIKITQNSYDGSRECFTDRNQPSDECDKLRSKISNLQNQINLHLRKIDEMNLQIKDRDNKITTDSVKISDLQRILRDQENLINDQSERLIEGHVKVAELSAKLQEYAFRLQQKSRPESKSPDLAESKIKELEKQLQKEREIHNAQISQLQNSL